MRVVSLSPSPLTSLSLSLSLSLEGGRRVQGNRRGRSKCVGGVAGITWHMFLAEQTKMESGQKHTTCCCLPLCCVCHVTSGRTPETKHAVLIIDVTAIRNLDFSFFKFQINISHNERPSLLYFYLKHPLRVQTRYWIHLKFFHLPLFYRPVNRGEVITHNPTLLCLIKSYQGCDKAVINQITLSLSVCEWYCKRKTAPSCMVYLFKRIPIKEPFGLNTPDKDQGGRGSSPAELFTCGQRTSALSSLENCPPSQPWGGTGGFPAMDHDWYTEYSKSCDYCLNTTSKLHCTSSTTNLTQTIRTSHPQLFAFGST